MDRWLQYVIGIMVILAPLFFAWEDTRHMKAMRGHRDRP